MNSPHLWSHTREIMISCTKSSVKYTIPLLSESNTLGKFSRVEKLGNNIVVYFDMKQEIPEQFKEKRDVYEKFISYYPGEKLQ